MALLRGALSCGARPFPLGGNSSLSVLVMANGRGGRGALLHVPQDEERVRGAAAASGLAYLIRELAAAQVAVAEVFVEGFWLP